MPFKQTTFDFDNGPEEKTPGDIVAPAPSPSPVKKETIPRQPVAVQAVLDNKLPAAKKSTRGRMKLSDMKASASLVEVPEDAVLFGKSYYSIGSVSEMFRVNASLIRFWENEFDILKPKKNGKGDRFFRPEDVKNLQLIYHLLRERKYTIEGAKEYLKNNKKADERFAMIESLKKLKSFLHELKTSL
jgi:DNA-binding transcriptional MerR regulator